ncbi:hypothetical protein [Mesorhizobium silamurunense]|uniref:hypothetical protein n=1 Tax=Mesorhizobium silamurunense TaxID=499528 RepID=UPI0017801D4C|nr:hypothetical protein [Mesorhizobium silamurunense]
MAVVPDLLYQFAGFGLRDTCLFFQQSDQLLVISSDLGTVSDMFSHMPILLDQNREGTLNVSSNVSV